MRAYISNMKWVFVIYSKWFESKSVWYFSKSDRSIVALEYQRVAEGINRAIPYWYLVRTESNLSLTEHEIVIGSNWYVSFLLASQNVFILHKIYVCCSVIVPTNVRKKSLSFCLTILFLDIWWEPLKGLWIQQNWKSSRPTIGNNNNKMKIIIVIMMNE